MRGSSLLVLLVQAFLLLLATDGAQIVRRDEVLSRVETSERSSTQSRRAGLTWRKKGGTKKKTVEPQDVVPFNEPMGENSKPYKDLKKQYPYKNGDLYRGDGRAPEVIFESGFKPRPAPAGVKPNFNILDYQQQSEKNKEFIDYSSSDMYKWKAFRKSLAETYPQETVDAAKKFANEGITDTAVNDPSQFPIVSFSSDVGSADEFAKRATKGYTYTIDSTYKGNTAYYDVAAWVKGEKGAVDSDGNYPGISKLSNSGKNPLAKARELAHSKDVVDLAEMEREVIGVGNIPRWHVKSAKQYNGPGTGVDRRKMGETINNPHYISPQELDEFTISNPNYDAMQKDFANRMGCSTAEVAGNVKMYRNDPIKNFGDKVFDVCAWPFKTAAALWKAIANWWRNSPPTIKDPPADGSAEGVNKDSEDAADDSAEEGNKDVENGEEPNQPDPFAVDPDLLLHPDQGQSSSNTADYNNAADTSNDERTDQQKHSTEGSDANEAAEEAEVEAEPVIVNRFNGV